MSDRIFTVLTIDGGGVRGIISARVLQEIEERTGKAVSELFDLVAGSSTGAILAGSLTAPSKDDPTKPRYTAAQMKSFYDDYAAEIFPPMKYRQLKHLLPGASGFFDPAPFERILEERLDDLSMKDSLTHLMIAGADMKKFTPVWMSYFKEDGKRADFPQKWESLKIKDAIRASASPPTIFPAKYIYTQPNKNNPQAKDRHAFLDGSLFAATITRRAYTTARKLAPKDARIVLVSLGTGTQEPSLTPDEMNRMSLLDWVRNPRGASIMNASVELTIRDLLNDVREELGEDLFRLDTVLDPDDPHAPDMNLTNARADNMDKLLKVAEKMIEARDEEIDRICEILLARYEAERQFEKSGQAFTELSGRLHQCENSKTLNSLYTKIIHYTSKEKGENITDQDVFTLSRALKPLHQKQLSNLYEIRYKALIESEAKSRPNKGLWARFNIFSRKQASNDNDVEKPARRLLWRRKP